MAIKNKTAIYILIILVVSAVSFATAQTSVKHPEWSRNQTIYEVNLRQYSPGGTFKEFENDLPRLKELGVGILWLMPIHPIGEKNRKGTLGSYYAVKDYKDINPEFGTKEDFQSLVNKIHELGMYVIIDWVGNHTAWDNDLVNEHPEWYTKDSLGNFVPPVADWADVIDLNYDNKELWEYMSGALSYWVKDFNIDGYRCDVAGMVPIEFWNYARTELDKIKPVFMLAEAESPEMHTAFDMTYGWDLHHVMNKISKGENNVTNLIKELNKNKEKYPADAYRMQFTSNHDENTWNGTVFERMGDAAETFAVLTVMVPGMPLLYNGQEAGMDKRLEFFEKDTINWKEHKFTELYKTLFNYKLNSKTLQNGEAGAELIIISGADTSVFAFVREKDGEKILSIFNLSPATVTAELNSSRMKGNYTNLFTKEEVSFPDAEKIELKPWEYRVLIHKK